MQIQIHNEKRIWRLFFTLKLLFGRMFRQLLTSPVAMFTNGSTLCQFPFKVYLTPLLFCSMVTFRLSFSLLQNETNDNRQMNVSKAIYTNDFENEKMRTRIFIWTRDNCANSHFILQMLASKLKQKESAMKYMSIVRSSNSSGTTMLKKNDNSQHRRHHIIFRTLW